jgi:hypothetical protein
LNIFGPGSIPQLASVVSALEQDAQVKVVVFNSYVPGHFLTHYDFLASWRNLRACPELYGYVNRSFPDSELDEFVGALANPHRFV